MLRVITPAAIGPQYFRESAEVINAAAAIDWPNASMNAASPSAPTFAYWAYGY